MNPTRIKILISCFLGSFLGALSELQLHHHLSWLGILIGAVAGYVSYDFKEIPRMFHRVWQQMPERKRMAALLRRMTGDAKYISSGIAIVLGIIVFFGGGLVLMVFSFVNTIFIMAHYAGAPIIDTFQPPTGLWFYIGGTVWVLIGTPFVFDWMDGETYRWEATIAVGCFAPAITPVVIPLVLAIIALILCLLILAVICICLVLFAIAAYKTFRLVHSDMRLLCLVDSAIGGTAGYYLGNPIIGGIIGALCGLLNYELVSVRWLRLVPVKS